MKKKLFYLITMLLLLGGAANAQQTTSQLTKWSGEVVGFDAQTNIVTLYAREQQLSHKVWIQKATQVFRDGQARAMNNTDLLLGDIINVDGFRLDDGRVLGVGVHYPAPVASAPANRTTLWPQAGSRLNSARPTVSANFAGQLDPTSVRLFVDGQEVTRSTAVDAKNVTFNPRVDMAAGRHQVHLLAKDDWGDVNQVWSFETMQQAQAAPIGPMTLNVTNPTNNSQVAKTFTITGTTRPGATVNMSLTPNTKVLGGFLGVKGQTVNSQTTATSNGAFRFNVNSPYKRGTEIDISLTAADGSESTNAKHYTVVQQ